MPPNPVDDRVYKLNQVYSQLDRKFEEEETQRKSKQHKLPYINLTGFPIDVSALSAIPKKLATDLGIAPFFREGNHLKIGVFEPTDAIDAYCKALAAQKYKVEVYQISRTSLAHFIQGYERVVEVVQHSEDINLTAHKLDLSKIKSLDELGAHLSNASTTELIEQVMNAALDLDSPDIHLEPDPSGLNLRFRIDGVLQDVTTFSRDVIHNTVSRIKVLAKLKLNVIDVPQDGSFSLHYNKQEVDVRVSILPSAFGESVVMRLLRQDKGSLRFDDLGITGIAKERVEKEIAKPNGMILTTGPTGSGKTTTLYAILSKLNEPGVKIITLEDPVEYRISGITQTPISHKEGLTFASGLRAILRQDPDIVMVGEMRDLETAETASQAALTGHIVLSTLHTNDAAAAIPRLIDLGVKPFVLAPAINAIIAQRLVRKICMFCKEEYKLDRALHARVEMILKSIPDSAQVKLPKEMKFHHSPGCPKCNGLGYKGRMGVYEVFTISEEIERMIQKQASTTEIRKQAIKEGMITMAQDGILKALAAVTDVEEVFRVTEE